MPVGAGVGMTKKASNEPHAKRLGWLRNGNPRGDPSSAPRCGAKTRKGTLREGPAMRNGRRRMHGGASTGPRTLEGLARSKRANWKHGMYSARARKERRLLRRLLENSRALLRQLAGR